MDVVAPRYLRSDHVLWRDTGRHVLVLSPGSDRDLTLLGGGSAALWRLLGQRYSLPEIMAAFLDNHDGASPTEQEIVAALADLARRGLIRVEEAGG